LSAKSIAGVPTTTVPIVKYLRHCLLCLVWGFVARAADAARPNVVFILADDLGYSDLACYGHPYARTPSLDQLARDGTRFRQFNVTGVTCCPSRTGFMTGKFPATFRGYPANAGFGDRVTITELLKKHGYRTGHFGKWHIGPEEKNGTYGIDVVGSDSGAEARRKQDTRGRDAPIIDGAIKFIEENKSGPFYVNVWGHISHHPINPPAAYAARFKDVAVKPGDFSPYMREKFDLCRKLGGDVNESMRKYLGDVFSMDEDVGRLLKRIDELGLRENTIVVFSSDQGPGGLRLGAAADNDEAPAAKAKKKKAKTSGAPNEEFRMNQMGYSGDLRGGKHNQYEGGVRTPFIIRWPGHVPPGRVDENSSISGIDWLPTLCRIAGIAINAADFDGEDVSAAWFGGTHQRTQPLFWKTSNPRAEVSIRDGRWKFHYASRRRGESELYDLSRDPGERNNLASQHPDVVQALTAKAEKWNATLPTDYIKTADREN
jgi:arylsulfatase A-like enzyme